MKNDIILAGVGGQGILSTAAIIGTAALSEGLEMKQAEVHGMSQRGGDVQSNLRISDQKIYSDLVPWGGADLILSVEPMEALRYTKHLSKTGWLVTNSTKFDNIANYPDIEEVFNEIRKIKNHVLLDADNIAKKMGSIRSANVVILGAASPYLMVKYESLENAIRTIFAKKGEDVVNVNLEALAMGRKISEESH